MLPNYKLENHTQNEIKWTEVPPNVIVKNITTGEYIGRIIMTPEELRKFNGRKPVYRVYPNHIEPVFYG